MCVTLQIIIPINWIIMESMGKTKQEIWWSYLCTFIHFKPSKFSSCFFVVVFLLYIMLIIKHKYIWMVNRYACMQRGSSSFFFFFTMRIIMWITPQLLLGVTKHIFCRREVIKRCVYFAAGSSSFKFRVCFLCLLYKISRKLS